MERINNINNYFHFICFCHSVNLALSHPDLAEIPDHSSKTAVVFIALKDIRSSCSCINLATSKYTDVVADFPLGSPGCSCPDAHPLRLARKALNRKASQRQRKQLAAPTWQGMDLLFSTFFSAVGLFHLLPFLLLN
eukprot:1158239-Pelagomonas_calceolata.AAC.1